MMSSTEAMLFLTESQAACLIALREGKSVPELAIRAMLPLSTAQTGLAALSHMGLVFRDEGKKWHVTPRGRDFQFATIPDEGGCNGPGPGPGGERVLDILNRPMGVTEIAQRTGLSRPGVCQLVIKLHARGYVKFGDPENPFRLVMRADDQTPVLSLVEQRVFSAIPANYETTLNKIAVIVQLPEDGLIEQIIESLVARGLVQSREGVLGSRVYRVAPAGLAHPQRKSTARLAAAPHPGVHSDRVRDVLSAIADAGALRIREVAATVGVAHQSINALMQYLKRKQLVKKTGEGLRAPYCLTDHGQDVLKEMYRRQAA